MKETLLPAPCLLCSKFENRVCTDCAQVFAIEPRLVYRDGIVGFATMAYNDSARQMLRAYKELGESSLGQLIAGWMHPLLTCFTGKATRLVPIPSNRLALRERGFNPAEVITRELCSLDANLRYENILSRTRATLDQSKLNPNQRLENQTDSMIARVGSESVIIVDDVVTTGATMAVAAKTLEISGHRVLGFLAFAETEANGTSRFPKA